MVEETSKKDSEVPQGALLGLEDEIPLVAEKDAPLVEKEIMEEYHQDTDWRKGNENDFDGVSTQDDYNKLDEKGKKKYGI